MEYGPRILELRSQGKTYNEIVATLNCSKATVAYHCGDGQKQKFAARSKEGKKRRPLYSRYARFLEIREKKKNFDKTILKERRTKAPSKFTFTQLLDYLGENPHCHLTGRDIDLEKLDSYEFDHIVPVSKGGTNDLSNFGLACKEANRIKSDLLKEELFAICKEILKHNGYNVEKTCNMA